MKYFDDRNDLAMIERHLTQAESFRELLGFREPENLSIEVKPASFSISFPRLGLFSVSEEKKKHSSDANDEIENGYQLMNDEEKQSVVSERFFPSRIVSQQSRRKVPCIELKCTIL
jgi:hypothetical protein